MLLQVLFYKGCKEYSIPYLRLQTTLAFGALSSTLLAKDERQLCLESLIFLVPLAFCSSKKEARQISLGYYDSS